MNHITPAHYLDIRRKLFAIGYRSEWEWAQNVQAPPTAEHFAGEAIWVVCCSGFKEQAARVTRDAVGDALMNGRSATEVFPRSGKGRAIDRLWNDWHANFQEFTRLMASGASAEEIISWVGTLPYVGGRILRYHFAKNLGVDCAKPDRWLCRLTGIPVDSPVEQSFKAAMDLCRPLANATGDRIATVDLVLWRACNLGVLAP